MDDIERAARDIFRSAIDPSLWTYTWENAPPLYREICLMQARRQSPAGIAEDRAVSAAAP